MKIKRFLGIVLVVLMALAVIPTASLAKGVVDAEAENAKLRLLDTVWESLEAVEAETVAAGASRLDVVMAVYNAALNNKLVDACSFNEVTARSFFFTVDGMHCCYDFIARQSRNTETAESVKPVEVISGTKNGPVNMNVLLVGPYYGQDSSFTDQYRQEAYSIAEATGGTVTILQSYGATGPAIAAACPDNGIVIYDSHGTQSGNSSYLCLTTNSGITSQDYSNGWAVSAGNAAYIDGRYIENHIEGTLPNSIFWMAICEGMMRQGQGTTGYALLRAGAGCVYGYSQSVTFVGDYMYEATFWNEMKYNDATVAEAFNVMIATHGEPDPRGDAWAIVMSPDDPFPANPDSHQNVNCDWTLFGGNPIDPEALSFEEEVYGIAPSFQLKLEPIVAPEGANNYSKTWTTSNPDVAVVSNRGVVTGINYGTATITYTIASTQYSTSEFSYTASVDVVVSNEYLPEEEMYVPVTTVVPGETYLIGYATTNRNYVMSNEYYDAGHQRNLKTVSVTIDEVAGVNCVTSEVTEDMEWIWNGDGTIESVANGKLLTLSGNYLALGDEGLAWSYAPTEGANTGIITNNADTNFKYLGHNNTNAYFGAFFTGAELCLYRKLVRSSEQPPVGVAGDANGDELVDTIDALLILRYAMGDVNAIPAAQLPFCDYNGDGVVDTADALEVLRHAMGI